MVCLIIKMKNVKSDVPIQQEILDLKKINESSEVASLKAFLTTRKSGGEISNYFHRNRSSFYFLYNNSFELVVAGNYTPIFSEAQGDPFHWKFSVYFHNNFASQIVMDKMTNSPTWGKKKVYIIGDMRRECENITDKGRLLKQKTLDAYREYMAPIFVIITHDEIIKLLRLKSKDVLGFETYKKKLGLT
jgi:hypothetical protein